MTLRTNRTAHQGIRRQTFRHEGSNVQDSRRAHHFGPRDESSSHQSAAEDVDKHAAQASAYIRAAAIKGPSNRHLVRLALKHRCLAGAHLARKQESVLRALDACQNSSQFLILFGKLNGNKFRGLYALEKRAKKGGSEGSGGGGSELSSSKSARKVYGSGPPRITDSMVQAFFRYNSGSRSFQELRGTKSTTATTCAIALLPGCYHVSGNTTASGRDRAPSSSRRQGTEQGGVPRVMEDLAADRL